MSFVVKLLGGVLIVVVSFFVTLKFLDMSSSGPDPQQTSPIPEVAYDPATLPKLTIGQSLDFAGGKNRSALISGWSSPESVGVWSEGHTALVGLVADEIDSAGLDVVIRVDAFLVPQKLVLQNVQVWFGRKKISDFSVSSSSTELRIHVPGPLDRNGPITLGFYLPNASSPKSVVGSSDTRVVAIRVKSLELVADR